MGAIRSLFLGLKWYRSGIVSAVYTCIAGGSDVAGPEESKRAKTSVVFARGDMRNPTDGHPVRNSKPEAIHDASDVHSILYHAVIVLLTVLVLDLRHMIRPHYIIQIDEASVTRVRHPMITDEDHINNILKVSLTQRGMDRCCEFIHL
jgi:hypothetical protein